MASNQPGLVFVKSGNAYGQTLWGLTSANTYTQLQFGTAIVKAATTANITLSGPQTIDGVALVAGDKVLVKNQSTATQNGVYTVAAGTWTGGSQSKNVFVTNGTLSAKMGYTLSAANTYTGDGAFYV